MRGHAAWSLPTKATLTALAILSTMKSAGGMALCSLYYLKQPATNHTKQHLIARLREHYGDNWERFTHDFVPPQGIASFQHLLHHTACHAVATWGCREFNLFGDGRESSLRTTIG